MGIGSSTNKRHGPTRKTIRGQHPKQSQTKVHFGAALTVKGKGSNRKFKFHEVSDGGILQSAGIQNEDELLAVNERTLINTDTVESVTGEIQKMRMITLEMKRILKKKKETVHFIIVFNLTSSLEAGDDPRIHQYGFFWRTDLKEWLQVVPPIMRVLSDPPDISFDGDIEIDIQRPEIVDRLGETPQPDYALCLTCMSRVEIISRDTNEQLVAIVRNNTLGLYRSDNDYRDAGHFYEYVYSRTSSPDPSEILVAYVSSLDPTKCIAPFSANIGGHLRLMKGFNSSNPDARWLFNKQQTENTLVESAYRIQYQSSTYWKHRNDNNDNTLRIETVGSIFIISKADTKSTTSRQKSY